MHLLRSLCCLGAMVLQLSGLEGPAPVETAYGTAADALAIEQAMLTGDQEAVAAALHAAQASRGAWLGCPTSAVPRPTGPSIGTPIDPELVRQHWHTAQERFLADYAPLQPAIGRRQAVWGITGWQALQAGLEVDRAVLVDLVAMQIDTQFGPHTVPAPLARPAGAFGYPHVPAGDPWDPGGVPGDATRELFLAHPDCFVTYRSGRFAGTTFGIADVDPANGLLDGGAAYDHGFAAQLLLWAARQDDDIELAQRAYEHAWLAATWALAEPPVRNHNYTAKLIWFLADLYALSGDTLIRAGLVDRLDRNLLPGVLLDADGDGLVDGHEPLAFAGLCPQAQTPGRMWDGHNSLPWYQAINSWAVVCAYAAGRDRGDHSLVDRLRPVALAMTDNLAREILAEGVVAGGPGFDDVVQGILTARWRIERAEEEDRPLWRQASEVLWQAAEARRAADPHWFDRNLGLWAMLANQLPAAPPRLPWGSDQRRRVQLQVSGVAEVEILADGGWHRQPQGTTVTLPDQVRQRDRQIAFRQADQPVGPAVVVEGGRLNTNYTAGVGFSPGTGGDPHADPGYVVADDGTARSLVDAATGSFPNSRTDALAVSASDPVIAQTQQEVRERLGSTTRLHIHRPTAGWWQDLAVGEEVVQVVVNDVHAVDEHDLQVTWILPPNWHPDRRYVPLLLVPGMGHTTNTKLFSGDRTFMTTVLDAMADARNRAVIGLVVNCGGRVSMGLQPGWERVLARALERGRERLGCDLRRLVLGGGSRGGYGAVGYAGRLARLPGMRIRGIFASVFGTAGRETTVSHETVPNTNTLWGGPEHFPQYAHHIFQRRPGDSDLSRRLFTVDDPALVDALGPLGSLESLADAAAAAPMFVQLTWGSRDHTMAPSSAWRCLAAIAPHPELRCQARLVLGGTHGSGNAARNAATSRFAAYLAEGLAPERAELPGLQVGIFDPEGRLLATDRSAVVSLRLPIRGVVGRDTDFDLIGPPGAAVTVRFRMGTETLAEHELVIGAAGWAQPRWTLPDRMGTLTVDLLHESELVGSQVVPVVAALPTDWGTFVNDWTVGNDGVMPGIETVLSPLGFGRLAGSDTRGHAD